ncbi:MAG: class I SAM-dependent methyltransferase [Clostridia bacterium]|nr:class I SAM-dependent methyltransferase [Clostridia bacterium]
MLGQDGFDLWADEYDKSVGLSDESNAYPFAGYRKILNRIYNDVLSSNAKRVLDIGFGTGTLTEKLYRHGCHIYGQDFSEKMLELALTKMPEAVLYQGDFSKGLVQPLMDKKYDAIIATYSLHHLPDERKVSFLKMLQGLLLEGGHIHIGDVAFETCRQLEVCREQAGDEWDDNEAYFVIDDLKEQLPDLRFVAFSDCAGVIEIAK